MVRCPDGHDSVSEDFCDVCGILIGGAPSAAAGGPAAATGQGPACPACGAPKTGQFCEACGYNFATAQPAAVSFPPPPPPPPPITAPSSPPAFVPPDRAAWSAVVSADRDYYEVMRAASDPDTERIPFPSYCPDRRFMLTGQEMRIGRRSPSRGLEPEIDLTGPPADPGVSRLHAVLMSTGNGGWAVLDPGSANGTQVNGVEVEVGEQIPLRDGDRISIGAWTTITIHGA
jgi:FHA domain